jgi:hypothetical protein
LNKLDPSYNKIGTRGVRSAPWLSLLPSCLKSLLACKPMPRATLLCDKVSTLSSLDANSVLSSLPFAPQASAFASVLPELATLVHLNLNGNAIRDRGGENLIAYQHCSRLAEAALSPCKSWRSLAVASPRRCRSC